MTLKVIMTAFAAILSISVTSESVVAQVGQGRCRPIASALKRICPLNHGPRNICGPVCTGSYSTSACGFSSSCSGSGMSMDGMLLGGGGSICAGGSVGDGASYGGGFAAAPALICAPAPVFAPAPAPVSEKVVAGTSSPLATQADVNAAITEIRNIAKKLQQIQREEDSVLGAPPSLNSLEESIGNLEKALKSDTE